MSALPATDGDQPLRCVSAAQYAPCGVTSEGFPPKMLQCGRGGAPRGIEALLRAAGLAIRPIVDQERIAPPPRADDNRAAAAQDEPRRPAPRPQREAPRARRLAAFPERLFDSRGRAARC